jgi:hypothetical protein
MSKKPEQSTSISQSGVAAVAQSIAGDASVHCPYRQATLIQQKTGVGYNFSLI